MSNIDPVASECNTELLVSPTHLNGKAAAWGAPPGFIPAWELAATEFPPEYPLVGEWLYPGEIVLFVARQKEGKSTFALQLCLDLAFGAVFLNQFPTRKTRVMYVD